MIISLNARLQTLTTVLLSNYFQKDLFHSIYFVSASGKAHHNNKQELSYRQQIARQLRTQYAEGIYRLKYYTVTLKSWLRVTQGHWKRNHWIIIHDLVVVELFDVEYYCDFEM